MPDAFRNCTCGLKMWWESRLPVQASNKDSGVQGGEETEMTLWSSQCRQGSHWSPREQGSSGVSALFLPGVFVARVWGLN